jgi:hypothetical protein
MRTSWEPPARERCHVVVRAFLTVVITVCVRVATAQACPIEFYSDHATAFDSERPSAAPGAPDWLAIAITCLAAWCVARRSALRVSMQ